MEKVIRDNPRILLYATIALIFMCAILAFLIMFTLTLLLSPPSSEHAAAIPFLVSALA
jgi:hypothetical protein